MFRTSLFGKFKKSGAEGYNIIIRVPLIREVNASEEHLKRLALLARDLKIREVDLLPYHAFGETKYRQMRKEYQFKSTKIEKDSLNKIIKIFEDKNIKVTVGG